MKVSWLSALWCAAMMVSPAPIRCAETAYPRADLLVETSQLARPEVAKQFVVLDVRTEAAFKKGHIPGARWVNPAQWAKGFGQGKDAEMWSKWIGNLGISAESKVVVYDDNFTKDAARIRWVLRYWGVEDVRLLNGGWGAWQGGKYPSEERAAPPVATSFKARARSERLATREQLLAALKGTRKLQIVDARSENEFCGTQKLSNRRGGAIPGAKHLEWSDLLDRKTQRFKSADELRQVFAQAGVTLDSPTATYCQSGGRAAVMVFGLELMGAKDVSNYYPSWAEWGNATDTPIVPGKPREKK